MSGMKKIPKFKSEEEERAFWASHDSAEYLNWSKGERRRFPNLRPSVRTISIRLPEWMIDEMKILAHQRDVPYQSLIKIFLAEKIEERRSPARSRAKGAKGKSAKLRP